MGDGYTVSMQIGRVQAGEFDALFEPRTPRHRYGAVLAHGRGDLALSYIRQAQCFLDATNLPSGVRLAARLASNGITCIAAEFADNAWDDDTDMSRITSAASVLAAAGCDPAKIVTYGVSMGAGAVARYAMLNPTKVAAGYGTAPVSDLNDFYNNNIGGWRAEIGTAWGVTYPTPLPSGADLPGQAHLASAIPWKLDYGTADDIVTPSTVTALATAWGANCTATVTDTTNPHGEALFAKTDPAGVLAHFIANGA
jgi:dienelactone hydrolase